jgi:hypothetical protein|tara:strand:+ start:3498 stop:3749 length:252 start_codon:yes stop_codon:yes gene_type:complete
MNDNSYVKELRKDIKVIKKDLRAISIKTRSMARVLEISEENGTTPKVKPTPNKKVRPDINTKKISKNQWLSRVFKKLMSWIKK